jgi:alkanesulfonate monooxygenase SsuD/methylene tetrahydromethanopterin reductase-like flavin-dependent oxidoreductase (luciferase family)
MKIGIGLPAYIPNVEGSIILDWARQADNGPFSSLGVLDRLTYGNYEPLVVLAAAAGATKRIRLMTTVLLAPLRNTAMLAKQSASPLRWTPHIGSGRWRTRRGLSCSVCPFP